LDVEGGLFRHAVGRWAASEVYVFPRHRFEMVLGIWASEAGEVLMATNRGRLLWYDRPGPPARELAFDRVGAVSASAHWLWVAQAGSVHGIARGSERELVLEDGRLLAGVSTEDDSGNEERRIPSGDVPLRRNVAAIACAGDEVFVLDHAGMVWCYLAGADVEGHLAPRGNQSTRVFVGEGGWADALGGASAGEVAAKRTLRTGLVGTYAMCLGTMPQSAR